MLMIKKFSLPVTVALAITIFDYFTLTAFVVTVACWFFSKKDLEKKHCLAAINWQINAFGYSYLFQLFFSAAATHGFSLGYVALAIIPALLYAAMIILNVVSPFKAWCDYLEDKEPYYLFSIDFFKLWKNFWF